MYIPSCQVKSQIGLAAIAPPSLQNALQHTLNAVERVWSIDALVDLIQGPSHR